MQVLIALTIPALLSLPLGWWIARVMDRPADRRGHGIDALPVFVRRLIGGRGEGGMNWRRYAVAMLAFNAALFFATFAILWLQQWLPLNPDGKGALRGDLIFNIVCSFVTNCSLQHYAGEQHLSYASQIGVIAFLDFVSTATGIACLVAVIRGLRGEADLGDFYLDMSRATILVLIPCALVVAGLLVAAGVPMTWEGAAQATTLEGAHATIARGPAAALVPMKQLGTIGGGFFGPNSAHPFENPGPWSNLLQVVAIILLPMAAIVAFGVMLRDRAHAAVIFGVMLVPTMAGAVLAVHFERGPNRVSAGLPVAAGPNLEGKEMRFGADASATWAAITTASSNGAVDGMLDSFHPLSGLAALSLMLLNAAFSGVGSGFLHMLLYIVVAVFLGGLMVGRTPEYLGRKLEAREMKMAMIALLLHPLIICVPAALFAATAWGQSTVGNPGPHEFSEILYEFASSAATNGSGFEGLSDNNPPWNIATGIVMLLGRYPALIVPLAIAGSLARKPRLPQTFGTLRTDDLTFAGLLLGTMLLVGALSFLPPAVLGPVADFLARPPS
jgi:potassium-transporting ATPase potassium-binding subunit